MTNTPKEVQPEGLFDDAEVIDVYTDAEAIEDGSLVAVEVASTGLRALYSMTS